MTTIRDVARVAGVSPATVSRVVNGQPGYSAQTRERVRRVARELGYLPGQDSVASNSTAMIGLLAPVVSDALTSEIMSGVESVARNRGLAVVLGRTGPRAVHAPGYLRSFRTNRAAGVVLVGTEITPEMRRVLGPQVPFVCVAIRDRSHFPSLAIDDERAAFDGTRHLQQLGHRRIGLITGDMSSALVNSPRLAGYRRATALAGLTPVTAEGNSLYDSAPAAVHRVLEEDPALTAIFALSDEMGAAAVNELQRLGVRVPEDVSVLGFDNTRTARHVHPALTTVAQPLERMGALAVEMLLSPGGVRSRIMPHAIVERGSTSPPSISAHGLR